MTLPKLLATLEFVPINGKMQTSPQTSHCYSTVGYALLKVSWQSILLIHHLNIVSIRTPSEAIYPPSPDDKAAYPTLAFLSKHMFLKHTIPVD